MALPRRMAFKPIVVSTPFARITIACMAMGVMSANMFLNSIGMVSSSHIVISCAYLITLYHSVKHLF